MSEGPNQTGQFQFWQRRINGENMPTSEGAVEAGFYRTKKSEGGFAPVAYWFKQWDEETKTGTGMRCREGSQDIKELTALERWKWCYQNPISHDLYKAVIAGARWPDEHPEVGFGTGHNKAPEDDTFESLKERLDDLYRSAEALIKAGAAKDQAAADQATHLANAIADIEKRADARRVIEKRPHDEAAAAVQRKWKDGIIDRASIYKQIKAIVTTPWLKLVQAKIDAEKARLAKIAAEEAAKRRAAEEEAARTGEPVLHYDIPPGNTSERPAFERSTNAVAGRGGRRTSGLRTVTIVTITDHAKVYDYFKDHADVKEVLQKLADRVVKTGLEVPGTSVSYDKTAT